MAKFYIDFDNMPNGKNKYEKKMSAAETPEVLAKSLNNYFKKNTKFNIYSLALSLDMSVFRFKKHYLNSKDPDIKRLAMMAMDAIAAHALEFEDDYSRSLKYIITQTEIGQPFLELDDSVQDSNKAQIVILPEKKK